LVEGAAMERKRIIELSRRARAEAERENKELESQKRTASQKVAKKWKKTLAIEWLWLTCTLLVSFILSNIFEYYLPAGVGMLTIILVGLVYLTRLTFWAIKEAGKD
jgi:hypothetical protein